MRSNKNNKHVSFQKRIKQKALVITACIVVALTCFGWFHFENNIIDVLNYREQSAIDYAVYLKPNEHYETERLESGRQYISSLIDELEINFNYNFRMNKAVNITSTYYIDAKILVRDEADGASRVILDRVFELQEAKEVTEKNTTSFNINETIRVDYSKHSDFIRSLEQEHNISAISQLIVRMHVDTNSQYRHFKEPINTTNTLELIIPLSGRLVNVNTNYEAISYSEDHAEKRTPTNFDYVILGFGTLAGLAALAMLFKTILFINKANPKQNKYEKTLKKLLREYDRIIVETKTLIKITDDMEVFEIKNFTELLDVSDRLELPILYMEIHKEKCWFVVRDGKQIYRKIMKAVDFEDGKKP